MDQPTRLQIVELQALLEILENSARQVEGLASGYNDPRTSIACGVVLRPVYREIESIRRDIREAQSSVRAEIPASFPAF